MENSVIWALWLCGMIGFLHNIQPALCFSVDTRHPRIFTDMGAGSYFGYQVCQFGQVSTDSVLVTDPLRDNRTGGVYRCSYHSRNCEALPLKGEPGSTLGMTLTCDTGRAMVCGPHLSHSCGSFNYLNGLCMELGPQLNATQTLKPGFEECRHKGLDAVILFDDSQSINKRDFATMITFIKNIIRMFKDPKSQVAVAQFSTAAYAVFHFEKFQVDRDPDSLLRSVPQTQGQTYTPSAIRYVLEKMLTTDRGMREDSKKLLVVITDGKSNDPKETFDTVISMAEKRGVTRFAIGVGREYSRQELELIASSPKDVFESQSFSALNSIQQHLKEKIFPVEGTDKSQFSAFQFELSQGGFSAAFAQDAVLFGAVGAFEWSGGIVRETQGANSSFINASAVEQDMKDSFLGYSVAVAQVNNITVYFAGAPRYNHTGLVLAFQKDHLDQNWTVAHRIYGTQLGSYFGAELCTLHVSRNGWAGLLLAVGAPQYHSEGVGGEVRICTLDAGPLFPTNCSVSLHGSPGNDRGKFGASLSACPDLNGDGVPELVVGAPQEDGEKGSVYIFLGHPGGIRTKYSQKISGANIGNGLHYFGVSVHSSGDVSSDGLTDVVVGARGAAVLLRSQPVICPSMSVSFDPPVIPQDRFHCAAPRSPHSLVSTATACVTIDGVLTGSISAVLRAAVSMSLELDAQTRPARLHLDPNSASLHWTATVAHTTCYNLSISLSVNACISHYSAVPLSAQLTVKGQKVEGTEGLLPVMGPDCPSSFTFPVLLEEVCGEDHVCVSDLQVSLSITSVMVVSSQGYPVDVSVEVLNRGEDASGTEMTLVYPSALSFTHAKASSAMSNLYCVSNTTSVNNHTQTVCRLSTSVLRQGAAMKVLVFLSVLHPSDLTDTVTVQATVSSKNEHAETLQDNYGNCSVAVRLPINIIIKEQNSTRYLTLPGGKLLEHTFTVENVGNADVPVNVTFVVPVEMDFGLRWNVSLPVTDRRAICVTKGVISRNDKNTTLVQYCSGTICHLIGCTVDLLGPEESIGFPFVGNINGDIAVSGTQMKVLSWGFLSFDPHKYAQFPPNRFHNCTIGTVLETPSTSQRNLIIAGSVVSALLLMAIVFAILYKIGFFKSKDHDDDDDPRPPQQETEGTTEPSADRETTL
ncbi:integrin alpha-X-like isoform X1 [Megalops cyprinoides]|uniref:integrin alpha-X-like isoform X1 n=2 Tax=Megalops cyprinoides TaxID=118141 RepID=UPI001864B9A1|nr:integrin alpha-X-like isoform X1 [Megalops cyprinoides]